MEHTVAESAIMNHQQHIREVYVLHIHTQGYEWQYLIRSL